MWCQVLRACKDNQLLVEMFIEARYHYKANRMQFSFHAEDVATQVTLLSDLNSVLLPVACLSSVYRFSSILASSCAFLRLDFALARVQTNAAGFTVLLALTQCTTVPGVKLNWECLRVTVLKLLALSDGNNYF